MPLNAAKARNNRCHKRRRIGSRAAIAEDFGAHFIAMQARWRETFASRGVPWFLHSLCNLVYCMRRIVAHTCSCRIHGDDEGTPLMKRILASVLFLAGSAVASAQPAPPVPSALALATIPGVVQPSSSLSVRRIFLQSKAAMLKKSLRDKQHAEFDALRVKGTAASKNVIDREYRCECAQTARRRRLSQHFAEWQLSRAASRSVYPACRTAGNGARQRAARPCGRYVGSGNWPERGNGRASARGRR